jgi:hypothetical protein
MTEVLTRFGGFSGLSGTRVREATATQHHDFFVVKQQKRNRGRYADDAVTPVPNNPENPPNLVRTSVMDAGMAQCQ